MNSIEKRIEDHYNNKQMPEARVDALLRRGSGRRKLRERLRVWAVAAALLVAATGLYRYWQQGELAERVFVEVAMNHRKNLTVEVASGRYETVQQGLDRLDFSILPAAETLGPQYALLGGRYCSIQGRLAAQLKVQDRRLQKAQTLYVAQLHPSLAEIVPLTQERDGVRIRLWSADGRFFALAEDMTN